MNNLSIIQDIVREVLDNDDLVLSRKISPQDVEGWDSLANITILDACESDFGVKFDVNDIIAVNNIGDLLDLLEKKLG